MIDLRAEVEQIQADIASERSRTPAPVCDLSNLPADCPACIDHILKAMPPKSVQVNYNKLALNLATYFKTRGWKLEAVLGIAGEFIEKYSTSETHDTPQKRRDNFESVWKSIESGNGYKFDCSYILGLKLPGSAFDCKTCGVKRKTTDAETSYGFKLVPDAKKTSDSKPVEKPAPSVCLADKLMGITFSAICWAVVGLLPSGYLLLAGKPKMGKSLLALCIAIAVSSFQKALGHFDVEGGTVIYLGLEDTLRRLQGRLKKMFSCGGTPSPRLRFFTEWPRMDKGGLELLDAEISGHPDTRLVIIDTLAKFKPPRPSNVDPYEHDYACGTQLKELADKHNISILVIHHMRKMKADDPFDSVSGTFGVTGAADGTLLLVRKMGQADAELHIVGRDVEQDEYALKFYPETLSWDIMGRLLEIKSTEQKQKLYDAIREYGDAFSPKQIATVSGLSASYVGRMLPYLVREGNVRKLKRGRYELVS